MATLPNGKVLVIGGSRSSTGPFYDGGHLYDPATNRWSPAAPMSRARGFFSTTVLPNGKVLVVGGDTGGAAFTAAEIYDPELDQWTAAAPAPTGRVGHCAVLLPAIGRVLFAGPTSRVDLYDWVTNTWSDAGSMTASRHVPTCARLRDGRVLVAGGEFASTYLNTAEVYDPATDVWTLTDGGLSDRRSYPGGILLPDGRVLIAGGYDGQAS